MCKWEELAFQNGFLHFLPSLWDGQHTRAKRKNTLFQLTGHQRVLHRMVEMMPSQYVHLRNINQCGPWKLFLCRIVGPKTGFQGTTRSCYLISISLPIGSLLYVTKGYISHQNEENYTHQAIKLANETWNLKEIEPGMMKNNSEY